MRHALIAMILVGCGSPKPAPETSTPPPPPTGPAADQARATCAAAIHKAATTGRGDEVFSAEDQMFNAEIETAMTDGCVAKKWEPHILGCLANGTSRDELGMCAEIMSPIQREDMMERMLVVAKAHEAAKPPAPAPKN